MKIFIFLKQIILYFLVARNPPRPPQHVHRAPSVRTAQRQGAKSSVRALIGALSDKIGRKKTFLIVGVCAAVLLPMCYLGLAKTTDITHITLYALAISFIGNAGYAPVLIFLNERFPTSMRASGTGLSWNIGFALGGMMPTFVSLASAGTSQIPMSLSIFAVGIFVVYLIGALIIPETKGNFR